MTDERPVVVNNGNSAVPVILSLIAAGLIAFALWFVLANDDEGDDLVPEITVTSIGS